MQSHFNGQQTGRRNLVWVTCGNTAGIFSCLNISDLHHISFYGLLLYSLIFIFAFSLEFVLILTLTKGAVMHFLPELALIGFIMLGYCAGVLQVSAYDNFKCRELKNTAETSREYTGVVSSEPIISDDGKTYGFPVRITGCEQSDGFNKLNGNIMLYTKADKSIAPDFGQVIKFKTKLNPPKDKSFDGGFSERDYLYQRGFMFSAFAKDGIKPSSGEMPVDIGFWLTKTGYKIRNSIKSRIVSAFGASSSESALLKGLLIGDRNDFSSEQYANFRQSGFVHVTAVSGMHVMFLYSIVSFITRKLRLMRFLQNTVTIVILAVFTAVAAFSPSTCRAVIMMLSGISALILKRETDPLTSLAASGLILTAINPYIITSYSFVLSFAAVGGIIIISRPLYGFLRKTFIKTGKKSILCRFTDSFMQSITVSLGASLGLGYFSMRFFNFISWGSIIGNTFVIPLASIGFIGGVVIWLISFICPFLAKFVAGFLLRPILWLINRIADTFSLRVFGFNTFTPPKSAFVLYIIIIYFLYQFLKSRENIRKV